MHRYATDECRACRVLIDYMLTLRHRCTEVNEIMRADTIAKPAELRCTTSTYQAWPGQGLCPLPRTKFEPWGSLHTADCGFYTLLSAPAMKCSQQHSKTDLRCRTGGEMLEYVQQARHAGMNSTEYVIQLPGYILAPRQTRMIAGAGLASAEMLVPGTHAATIRDTWLAYPPKPTIASRRLSFPGAELIIRWTM
jgi:hypothetical protein